MSFTYSLDTDTGKVRLLIPDTRSDEYVFEDDEIAAFLSIEGSSVRRAAALALETIATDEARVQKVIEISNLKTDGAKLAEALLKRADRLRTQALEDESSDGSAFDWAELGTTDFSQRELWYNAALRGQL